MSGDLGRGVVAVEGLRPGDIPHPLGLGSPEEQVRGGLHCDATHLNSGLGQICGSQSGNVGVHHGVGAGGVPAPSTLVQPLRDVAVEEVRAVHGAPVRDVRRDDAQGSVQEPVIPAELLQALIPRSALASSSSKPSWFLSTLRKKSSFFLPQSGGKKKTKFSFLPREEKPDVLVQHIPEVPQLVPELVHAHQAGGLAHVHPSLGGCLAVGGDRREHVPASHELRVCPNLGADRREPVRVDQDQGGCPGVGGDRHEPVSLGQDLGDCPEVAARRHEPLRARQDHGGCSSVGGDLREEVPAAHVGDVPCGEISSSLEKYNLSEINEIMCASLAESTRKQYAHHWQIFRSYGLDNGILVNKFKFDFAFVCQFFLYRIQNNGSLSSIMSARSAIRHYWRLNSALPSPTESHFVDLFIKGLRRKYKKLTKKSYPVSYTDLVKIFDEIVGASSLDEISLIDLRFISFIITLFSSFSRYEEACELKISDVQREGSSWVLTYFKGKSYQIGESNIGVVVDLPGLKFNPAEILSLYIEKMSYLYTLSDTSSDLLFPSFHSSSSRVLTPLVKPVSYSNICSKFKSLVKKVGIPVGLNKVGLHCMRRGGVTHAVRAGAPHSVVQKAMRVQTEGMVGYYATLQPSDLASVSKLAF